MVSVIEPGTREHKTVKGLLGRGWTVLGLAAVAHADGRKPLSGKWRVLSNNIIAATEQVLSCLEKTRDLTILQGAVMLAMSNKPSTAIPKWARVLHQDDGLFSYLGGRIATNDVKPALGLLQKDPSPRLRGMAAVALALCRNQDTLQSLAKEIPERDGQEILRMSRLAQATAAPGQPSTVRGEIRRLLKERNRGKDN